MNTEPVSTITPDLAAYVEAYTSKFLTDAQAAAWMPRLRELVAQVPPRSEGDGRGMLSAGCRFLHDMAPGCVSAVDEVMTRGQLGRWSYRLLAGGVDDQTARQYSARVGRLVRVRHGLPGRVGTTAVTKDLYVPLSFDELDVLFDSWCTTAR